MLKKNNEKLRNEDKEYFNAILEKIKINTKIP